MAVPEAASAAPSRSAGAARSRYRNVEDGPYAIPAHLRRAIESGDCVAVVGAGFSAVQRFPTWVDLLSAALETAVESGRCLRDSAQHRDIAELLGKPIVASAAAAPASSSAAASASSSAAASAAASSAAASAASDASTSAAPASPAGPSASNVEMAIRELRSAADTLQKASDNAGAVADLARALADILEPPKPKAPEQPKAKEPTMDDLWHAAQALEEILTHDGLVAAFREKLVVDHANIRPEMLQRLAWLQQIPFRAVVTTNFDSLLRGSTAMTTDSASANKPFGHILRQGVEASRRRYWSEFSKQIEAVHESLNSSSSAQQLANFASLLDNHTVIKLHGDVESGRDVVVTRQGYRDLLYGTAQYAAFIKSLMSSSTLLFLGFSFTDIYVNEIRQEVLSMLDISPQALASGQIDPLGYAIMNDFPASKKKYWLQHEGIAVLDYDTRGPGPEFKEKSIWNGFNTWFEAIYETSSPIPVLGSLLYEKAVMVLSDNVSVPHTNAHSLGEPVIQRGRAMLRAAETGDWVYVQTTLNECSYLINFTDDDRTSLLFSLVDCCLGTEPLVGPDTALELARDLLNRGAALCYGLRREGRRRETVSRYAAVMLDAAVEYVEVVKMLQQQPYRLAKGRMFHRKGRAADQFVSARRRDLSPGVKSDDVVRLLQAASAYVGKSRAVGFEIDIARTVSEALVRHAIHPYPFLICQSEAGAAAFLEGMMEQRLLRVPVIVYRERPGGHSSQALSLGAANVCDDLHSLVTTLMGLFPESGLVEADEV